MLVKTAHQDAFAVFLCQIVRGKELLDFGRSSTPAMVTLLVE